MNKIIHTPDAPAPIGPYSQAVLSNNMLYISGQIAIYPHTSQFENQSVEAEARLVMNNVKAIIAEAGFSFDDLVKCTIFLVDMNDFAVVNSVYESYFNSIFPAREAIAVKALPKGARVEISAIASK